jgi:hypothetical protein
VSRERDAKTIFAVRFLFLGAILSVAVAFLIAGTAKVVAPGHDAGHLALTVSWPAGAALALLLRWWWHRKCVLQVPITGSRNKRRSTSGSVHGV